MSVGVVVVGTGFGCFTHVRALQAAGFEGITPPPGPRPATFADGLADMLVLDAIRRSATERTTVTLARRAGAA